MYSRRQATVLESWIYLQGRYLKMQCMSLDLAEEGLEIRVIEIWRGRIFGICKI